MRGTKTVLPRFGPVMILATMSPLGVKSVTSKRVPLQRPSSTRRFRSNMTGTPRLMLSTCGGKPPSVSELRNSVGIGAVSALPRRV